MDLFAKTEEINLRYKAKKLTPLYLNPDFSLKVPFQKELGSLIDAIAINSIWQHGMESVEELFYRDIEPSLLRCAP